MRNLSNWIDFIQKQHNSTIDLNLERISFVADKLSILQHLTYVILVGGTNGKGSTVAGLEAILLAGGYRVGTFTSPYLYKFNEIVRIQGKMVADNDFISAFELIEVARGNISLTVFEFNTLAALLILSSANLDVMILEVGLGGRLDAVNVVTPDISVVTSIGIDHVDWLGGTREAIAYEKAGIFRKDVPAVCGDSNPPSTLIKQGVPIYVQDKDFGFVENIDSWDFWSERSNFIGLPKSNLLLQNMATALQVLQLCESKFPVEQDEIELGLRKVNLPGRVELRANAREIFDVSHNLASTKPLLNYLRNNPIDGKSWAVFSMLVDKDILAVLKAMKPEINIWVVAPLKVSRAASIERLQAEFVQAEIDEVSYYDSIRDAYREVKELMTEQDRVVVFGSFYTLAAI